MPFEDKIYLTICLRKEVSNVDQARILKNIVINRLNDHPEVSITTSVSTVLDVEVPEGS